MKKTVLSFLMAALALTGCAADGKLHVKMNCKNVGDTIIVMMADRSAEEQVFTGKQGVFDFTIDMPKPALIYLIEPSILRGNRDAGFYMIPAVGGEEVTITAADATRYDLGGSRFYQQYNEADQLMEAVQKEMSALSKRRGEMIEAGTPPDSATNVYNAAMEPLKQKMEQTILNFVKTHPDYEASAAIIPMLDHLESMKQAVTLLSADVRDGRMKPLYQSIIDQVEAQQKAEAEAEQKQAAGIEAPDFTLNDLNGKPLSLSSLRGKYVIIDFWGSWCGWCIKGFPKMKEYYNKYQGKFEILGVDCNDSEEKWRDAVKKHELPWLHVYNPRQTKVLADYAIQGFPTKIIVGPDGKIVKTIVGEDPQFYTLLDQLFK
jgi:thiol-disulfide isomerase/thioredoxin